MMSRISTKTIPHVLASTAKRLRMSINEPRWADTKRNFVLSLPYSALLEMVRYKKNVSTVLIILFIANRLMSVVVSQVVRPAKSAISMGKMMFDANDTGESAMSYMIHPLSLCVVVPPKKTRALLKYLLHPFSP